MSITENAVVRITIDDREARAQLAAFERAKQQAMAGGTAAVGGGSPAGQIGSQALGRSAALVGATAPATRAVVSAGGVTLPPGSVAYHDITRAMQALPQGTPQGQVMALARQYAGGAPAQTAERAGEQIVQREVEGLRRGMARGAQQAATQAGAAAQTAAAGGGGRPLLGGVLGGTSPLLSLGAFSFSAMALATGAISAAGAASDVYRESQGVSLTQRSLDERRLAATRSIGSRVEPARAWWEDLTTRALETAAYGVGSVSPSSLPGPGAQAPAPPPPATPGGVLGDIARPVTDALQEAGRQISSALDQWLAPGGATRADLMTGLTGRMAAVGGQGMPVPAMLPGWTSPRPYDLPQPRTPAEQYGFQQQLTQVALGRRDLADQASAISRARGGFAQDQAREREQFDRGYGRQAEDLARGFGRAERDLGVGLTRARRDIGVSLGDAYADLATGQAQGRQNIERGYQRSIRGAVLSEVLPGGLTGGLISAAIQRQDAMADLETGGGRQAAAIGLRGDRAIRDLGTRQGDMLTDLATQRADAEADMRQSYQRSLDDLLAGQRLAADRFAEQLGLMEQKLTDSQTALDFFAKKIMTSADDFDTLSKAEEEYRKSLRAGGEAIEATGRWVNRALQE